MTFCFRVFFVILTNLISFEILLVKSIFLKIYFKFILEIKLKYLFLNFIKNSVYKIILIFFADSLQFMQIILQIALYTFWYLFVYIKAL